MDPKVSVIIPAYNTIDYISEAVDSALNQTYHNVEVIIIDDGSTDGTYDFLKKKYGDHQSVRILCHENNLNKGVSKTRKLGVDYSAGQYIAFLDADDFFTPKKIEIQVSLLKNHRDAVLCHSHIQVVSDCDDTPDFERSFFRGSGIKKYHLLSSSDCLKYNAICNSTTLVRADILKKLDFDFKQVFQFEDWLLWMLLSECGYFIYTPEKLLNYRFHPKAATQKVYQSELIQSYSQVEFYLSLIHRIRSWRIKLLCLKEILIVTRKLYRHYRITKKGE
jgi:glycosyltransferase involved in cell wall biosynthesis